MENIIDNWQWIAIGGYFGYVMGVTTMLIINVYISKQRVTNEMLEEINQDFDNVKHKQK